MRRDAATHHIAYLDVGTARIVAQLSLRHDDVLDGLDYFSDRNTQRP
jgi:hypothetical protein